MLVLPLLFPIKTKFGVDNISSKLKVFLRNFIEKKTIGNRITFYTIIVEGANVDEQAARAQVGRHRARCTAAKRRFVTRDELLL